MQSVVLGGILYLMFGQRGFWVGFVAPSVFLLLMFAAILVMAMTANASIVLDPEAITLHQRLRTKRLHWSELVSAEVVNSNVWPNVLLVRDSSLAIAINFNLIPQKSRLVQALKARLPSNLVSAVDWSRIEGSGDNPSRDADATRLVD